MFKKSLINNSILQLNSFIVLVVVNFLMPIIISPNKFENYNYNYSLCLLLLGPQDDCLNYNFLNKKSEKVWNLISDKFLSFLLAIPIWYLFFKSSIASTNVIFIIIGVFLLYINNSYVINYIRKSEIKTITTASIIQVLGFFLSILLFFLFQKDFFNFSFIFVYFFSTIYLVSKDKESKFFTNNFHFSLSINLFQKLWTKLYSGLTVNFDNYVYSFIVFGITIVLSNNINQSIGLGYKLCCSFINLFIIILPFNKQLFYSTISENIKIKNNYYIKLILLVLGISLLGILSYFTFGRYLISIFFTNHESIFIFLSSLIFIVPLKVISEIMLLYIQTKIDPKLNIITGVFSLIFAFMIWNYFNKIEIIPNIIFSVLGYFIINLLTKISIIIYYVWNIRNH